MDGVYPTCFTPQPQAPLGRRLAAMPSRGTLPTRMYPALNAWTFPPDVAPAAQLAQAAAAGCAVLELVIAADGWLTPATPAGEFTHLARVAQDHAVRVVGLATALFWDVNYGCPEPAQRRRAIDLTRTLLDQAVAAQAGAVLVVPAVVGRYAEASPRVGYLDALHRTFEALVELRHDAEARGVVLALENVWNRFLLSPLDWIDLLDRVNSPCVHAYFDTGNCLALGYPDDWIRALAGRIARVHVKDYDLTRGGPAGFCPLGAGSVNWPAVVGALRDVGYDGPLTYEGPGVPQTIARQLRQILAGAPVDREGA